MNSVPGPEREWQLLFRTIPVGPLTPSQLGDRVGLTRGSITSAVDRLSARGLVKRIPNVKDTRSCFVKLTKAGPP